MTVATLSCITPPFLLTRLLDSDDRDVREAALATLMTTEQLRGERQVRALIAAAVVAAGDGHRSIFDCRHGTVLPSAVLARSEGDGEVADITVNRAFDGLGATRDFYREVFQRRSLDDRGMALLGYVHRGTRYNNAFWDGQQIVFGDGDGRVFSDFTASLDVIAHELGHGVTEHTAALEYHNQSGALNESLSDVAGVMVKQWRLRQTADQAAWLIGAEVFTPQVDADALRSLKAPGTAFDNQLFGRDPQPAHMDGYLDLPDTPEGDHGGVHINSGIPNRAFYLTATGIGGFSWEAPGHIWYEAMRASTPTTDFATFAGTTIRKAEELYGADSRARQAVGEAWEQVGVRVSTTTTAGRG
ncbi:M4 family metallopeptidase [Actinoplanes teichomyceticus]|uniref:Neutral metalloproteinase n=1 Tax=Actinoplanes teichomyceticus TaxID=1867 RepID=A0A561VLG6_ACTTI|nr:M4 family metallopeptidase [Actinoplanes teichomyceticus]TWG12458.1 thermolysin metallopeptidase-like protein [Actinoplanes teichomyceticus]GIF13821.1 metalloprotease [Actinoplanes teichomyceticus]